MKRIYIFCSLILLISLVMFPISLDIKTHMSEKGELSALKAGATYYLLEDEQITIIDIGEDYSVWLKELEISFKTENWYEYSLMVKLSFPTAFKEKETIREKRVSFTVELKDNEPRNKELARKLKKHFVKLSARKYIEAKKGGRKIAETILYLLMKEGAVSY